MSPRRVQFSPKTHVKPGPPKPQIMLPGRSRSSSPALPRSRSGSPAPARSESAVPARSGSPHPRKARKAEEKEEKEEQKELKEQKEPEEQKPKERRLRKVPKGLRMTPLEPNQGKEGKGEQSEQESDNGYKFTPWPSNQDEERQPSQESSKFKKVLKGLRMTPVEPNRGKGKEKEHRGQESDNGYKFTPWPSSEEEGKQSGEASTSPTASAKSPSTDTQEERGEKRTTPETQREKRKRGRALHGGYTFGASSSSDDSKKPSSSNDNPSSKDKDEEDEDEEGSPPPEYTYTSFPAFEYNDFYTHPERYELDEYEEDLIDNSQNQIQHTDLDPDSDSGSEWSGDPEDLYDPELEEEELQYALKISALESNGTALKDRATERENREKKQSSKLDGHVDDARAADRYRQGLDLGKERERQLLEYYAKQAEQRRLKQQVDELRKLGAAVGLGVPHGPVQRVPFCWAAAQNATPPRSVGGAGPEGAVAGVGEASTGEAKPEPTASGPSPATVTVTEVLEDEPMDVDPPSAASADTAQPTKTGDEDAKPGGNVSGPSRFTNTIAEIVEGGSMALDSDNAASEDTAKASKASAEEAKPETTTSGPSPATVTVTEVVEDEPMDVDPPSASSDDTTKASKTSAEEAKPASIAASPSSFTATTTEIVEGGSMVLESDNAGSDGARKARKNGKEASRLESNVNSPLPTITIAEIVEDDPMVVDPPSASVTSDDTVKASGSAGPSQTTAEVGHDGASDARPASTASRPASVTVTATDTDSGDPMALDTASTTSNSTLRSSSGNSQTRRLKSILKVGGSGIMIGGVKPVSGIRMATVKGKGGGTLPEASAKTRKASRRPSKEKEKENETPLSFRDFRAELIEGVDPTRDLPPPYTPSDVAAVTSNDNIAGRIAGGSAPAPTARSTVNEGAKAMWQRLRDLARRPSQARKVEMIEDVSKVPETVMPPPPLRPSFTLPDYWGLDPFLPDELDDDPEELYTTPEQEAARRVDRQERRREVAGHWTSVPALSNNGDEEEPRVNPKQKKLIISRRKKRQTRDDPESSDIEMDESEVADTDPMEESAGGPGAASASSGRDDNDFSEAVLDALHDLDKKENEALIREAKKVRLQRHEGGKVVELTADSVPMERTKGKGKEEVKDEDPPLTPFELLCRFGSNMSDRMREEIAAKAGYKVINAKDFVRAGPSRQARPRGETEAERRAGDRLAIERLSEAVTACRSSTRPVVPEGSRSARPVDSTGSRSATPVVHGDSRSATPVVPDRSATPVPWASQSTTPVIPGDSRSATPTARQAPQPATPVVPDDSRSATPIAREASQAASPVVPDDSRSATPVPLEASQSATSEDDPARPAVESVPEIISEQKPLPTFAPSGIQIPHAPKDSEDSQPEAPGTTQTQLPPGPSGFFIPTSAASESLEPSPFMRGERPQVQSIPKWSPSQDSQKEQRRGRLSRNAVKEYRQLGRTINKLSESPVPREQASFKLLQHRLTLKVSKSARRAERNDTSGNMDKALDLSIQLAEELKEEEASEEPPPAASVLSREHFRPFFNPFAFSQTLDEEEMGSDAGARRRQGSVVHRPDWQAEAGRPEETAPAVPVPQRVSPSLAGRDTSTPVAPSNTVAAQQPPAAEETPTRSERNDSAAVAQGGIEAEGEDGKPGSATEKRDSADATTSAAGSSVRRSRARRRQRPTKLKLPAPAPAPVPDNNKTPTPDNSARPGSINTAAVSATMNNFPSFLDTSGNPMTSPVPRQAPSPAGPSHQANGSGSMPNLVNGLLSGGHQTDMNHLWTVVQELSNVLVENRNATAGIMSQVQQLQQSRDAPSPTSTQQVNGDANNNSSARQTAADLLALRTQLHNTQAALNASETQTTALRTLLQDYEASLTAILEKLRPYAYRHNDALLALHAHYNALLDKERQANVELRLDHQEWQQGLGRVAQYARAALKETNEGSLGYERKIRELKAENKVLRRLAGWEEAVDSEDEDEGRGEDLSHIS